MILFETCSILLKFILEIVFLMNIPVSIEENIIIQRYTFKQLIDYL